MGSSVERADGGRGRLRIAVTGAGGVIGSQVVRLLATGESGRQVVAITRRELPPSRSTGQVVVALADYADPDALHAALQGVDTLVFVSSDGPVAQVIAHHHNVVRAATETGVSHIVALSGLDADFGSPFCYAVSYAYTEQLLQSSGCQVSIARASIYTDFFLGFLRQARVSGQLRLPAGEGRISFVSRSDVAYCLAALAAARPTNRHHDVTGPESLDLHAIAAIAADEWRIPIQYIGITPAEYCVDLAHAGEDPWWTYAFSTMFASIREQRWDTMSEEVKRLAGSPPTSVRQVVARGANHQDTARERGLSDRA